MNKKQKIVLSITSILLALMTLFPPLLRILASGSVRNSGYDFIFTTYEIVNVGLLITQIFVVIFIGGAMYLLLKK
tara:strand:- start:286 stop:510 length:225 start_codon:yes stop_codon:yes gene_type:complete